MDVTELLRRLARLRLAVVAVVVAAVVVAGVAYLSADSFRQSRTAVVIVPPKVADVAGGDNPLLNLDNNLSQLAVVLSGSMGSPTVARALERAGATADYSVSTVTGDNPSFSQLSPQLVFTVTGADDAVTSRTATALVSQSRVALDALQERAGVPSTSRASIVVVSAPSAPVAVSGGRLRSAGSLGLGVLVLGLVLVLVVDAVRRRRGTPAGSGYGYGSGSARLRAARLAVSGLLPPESAAARTLRGPVAVPATETPAAETPAAETPAAETAAATPAKKVAGKKAPTKKAPAKKAAVKKAVAKKAPAKKAAAKKVSITKDPVEKAEPEPSLFDGDEPVVTAPEPPEPPEPPVEPSVNGVDAPPNGATLPRVPGSRGQVGSSSRRSRARRARS